MTKSTGKIPLRTLEEKLVILERYEAAPRGRKGAVLREFGVSASAIGNWAYARDHDEFAATPTGIKSSRSGAMTPKRQSAEIVRLRRELARAQADQEILKAALESAGKAHALLEKLAESAEPAPLRTLSEKEQSKDSSVTD
jgi:transposase